MARRTLAMGVGLLLLVALVFGVRACVGQRQERAMKDYVRETTDLVEVSNQQGDALFALLGGASDQGDQDQAVDYENTLNGYRVESAQLVDRARALDHPSDVDQAHAYLIEVLEFRRDGLKGIADSLPTALGDQDRREGTDDVTAQMQSLLASDVIFLQRFDPALQRALRDNDLADSLQRPESSFVPEIRWLQPDYVADRVGELRTGQGGGDAAAPGLHGNGIGTVSLGGQALAEGGSATVTLSDDLTVEAQVVNQGDNTETDVNVVATIGRGDDAIEASETLDSIAAGETKTVTISIGEQPPTGQSVPVVVEIERVPGEEKTDNNRLTASAIFTR